MTIRVGRRPGRPAGGRRVVDREVVLDAAERVIRRDGAGVSLEAIAIEAGVTKPIVYARVGGRTDVANALAERLADRMISAAGNAVDSRPYGRAMLASLIEANLVTVAAHRELFLYVTGGTSDESPMRTLYLAERSTKPMAQQLMRWRTNQGLDPSVALPWAYAVVGMLQLVSLWWLTETDRSAEELADHLAELLWSGFSTT
ncbi:MAG: TetR family transcriptional regulator [Ilumatobacteraceae bacterium]